MEGTGRPQSVRAATTRRATPVVRTCVGCRRRDDRSALLRVVAVASGAGDSLVLIPDPHHRLPGRGAWLHPVTACLDRAVRRRAFTRALRTGTGVDHTVLARWVEAAGSSGDTTHDNQQ